MKEAEQTLTDLKTPVVAIETEINKHYPDFEVTPRYFDMDTKPLTFEEWIVYMQNKPRKFPIIQHTYIGKYFVSTVYLGHNHSYWRDMPPLIFETMIFCEEDKEDPLEGYQERYTWKQQAIEGHEKAVKLAKGEIKLEDLDNE